MHKDPRIREQQCRDHGAKMDNVGEIATSVGLAFPVGFWLLFVVFLAIGA